MNQDNISVIIPVKDYDYSLKFLLYCLYSQTILPKEIIIIHSGEGKTEYINKVIKNFTKLIKIIYKKVSPLYPGTARNLGVKFSNCKYIAFLDLKTYPKKTWLEDSLKLLKNDNDVIFGKRLTYADTPFKVNLKYTSYGDKPYTALTGTVIKKEVFEKNIGTFLNTRAGEDIEWINRTEKSGVNFSSSDSTHIIYNGLFNSLFSTLKKWAIYSFSYSNIYSDINNQKKIYFFFFLYLFLIFFILFFADKLRFFSPNYGIIILLHIMIYFFLAGIYRPLEMKVRSKYLFPFKWLIIGIYRFLLDLSKSPGLLWGGLLLFWRKILNNLNNIF